MDAPHSTTLVSADDEFTRLRLLVDYDEHLRRGEAEFKVGSTTRVAASTDAEVRACLDVLEFVYPRAAAVALPERVGRFEVEKVLGQGGFGVVYLARDPSLGRPVALKIPRPHVLGRAELRERFIREARAAGRLDHPHIVPVYEVGVDGGVCFISSAYCDGGTLHDWLRRRSEPVSVQLAVQLVIQLADAVQHAHDRGVLHRDLKPTNILLVSAAPDPPLARGGLGREPTLKIADFGLAKFFDDDEGHTQSGVVFGTPAYMPPEQASSGTKQADARGDVYSLGVIFYELLTGRPPFVGDHQAVIRKLLTIPAPSPRLIRRDVPRDLETVYLKATARNRDQRYASAGELAADLRRCLASEPITVRRPREPLGKELLTRRNFAALTLSSLPVIGYALWPGGRQVEGNERRVTLTTNPEGAKIYFIPLNKTTGEPLAEKIIEAGKSPVDVPLAPGDYLVEAVLDDERFHEVYRHVPEVHDVLPGGHPHQLFYHPRDQDQQLIELHRVSIPPATVADGMAFIPGSRKFQMGKRGSTLVPLHFRSVPNFWLDPLEFTFGQYRKFENVQLPRHLRSQEHPDDSAMPVNFDSAVAFAERLGKRLPDEAEYEFAATSGGTRELSIDDEPAALRPIPIATSTIGPEGQPGADCVTIDPSVPIFGLCSNVAEWTDSCPVRFPGGESRLTPGLATPADFRIVRGGSTETIAGNPAPADRLQDPHDRIIRWRHDVSPGLGFRCARSPKPRLTKDDFPAIEDE